MGFLQEVIYYSHTPINKLGMVICWSVYWGLDWEKDILS